MGICIYKGDYEAITFFSLSLTYSLNINFSLSCFLPWINEVELKFTAVQRIKENMDMIKEETRSDKFDVLVDDNTIVKFKNVFLKYENDDSYVLKNINFDVKKNSKIGIIGR